MKHCLLLCVFLCIAGYAFAQAPAWWGENDIIDVQATTNDYAAANIGQAKNMAFHAIAEIDERFALQGGAGFTFSSLLGSGPSNDYAVINVGQLKNLVAPIYDRLFELGWFGQQPGSGEIFYPWTSFTFDDNDYAVANIGQLKNVFSFDFDNPYKTPTVSTLPLGPVSDVPHETPGEVNVQSLQLMPEEEVVYTQSYENVEDYFGTVYISDNGSFYYSEYFGWFAAEFGSTSFGMPDRWIFHLEHGWMWVDGSGPTDLWLYDTESLGWLWTAVKLYPALYWNAGQTWLYYYLDTGLSGSRGFYHFDNGNTIIIPDDRPPADYVYLGVSKSYTNKSLRILTHNLSDLESNPTNPTTTGIGYLCLGKGWITTDGTKSYFVPDTSLASSQVYYGWTRWHVVSGQEQTTKGLSILANSIPVFEPWHRLSMSKGWITAFVDTANGLFSTSMIADRIAAKRSVFINVKNWPDGTYEVAYSHSADDFKQNASDNLTNQKSFTLKDGAWLEGPLRIIPDFSVSSGPTAHTTVYFRQNSPQDPNFTHEVYYKSVSSSNPAPSAQQLAQVTYNHLTLTNTGDSGTIIGRTDATLNNFPNSTANGYMTGINLQGDNDNDGLSNGEELIFGTDMSNWDSDGDLLDDKFEINNRPFFNANLAESTDADFDDDGLTNEEELIFGSDPTLKDTDHDGVSDSMEIANGSNPSDPADQGAEVDEDLLYSVKLTLGDESGSKSEIYRLIVEEYLPDGTTRRFLTFPGTTQTARVETFDHFRKDRSYVFYLEHVSGSGDYDYTLDIEVVEPGFQRPVIEPDGFLGTFSDDGDPNDPNSPNPSEPYAKVSRGDVPGAGFPSKYEAYLLSIDVDTDLNNDGEIDQIDQTLKYTANSQDATLKDIALGKEYMFDADNLNNGLWDKDSGTQATQYDDDMEEIVVSLEALDEGFIAFNHPAFNFMEFYTSKERLSSQKITFPLDLEVNSSVFDNPIYMYVNLENDSSNTKEYSGDLKLLYSPDGNGSNAIELATIHLTVVKELGADNYFRAARDYIYENNTQYYADEVVYSLTKIYRFTVFSEKLSSMSPFDAYDHAAGEPKVNDGLHDKNVLINADEYMRYRILQEFPQATLIINGNFVKAEQPMSRVCIGEFVVGSQLVSPPSFLAIDESPPFAFEPYNYGTDWPEQEVVNWCYLGYDSIGDNGNPHYSFIKGRQFSSYSGDAPTEFGLGGLHNHLYDIDVPGAETATSVVGYYKEDDASDMDNMLFNAMIYTFSGFKNVWLGELCEDSGIDRFEDGNPKILVFDGDSSLAMARKNPSGGAAFSYPVMGAKHFYTLPSGLNAYRINSYLVFSIERPRAEQ